MLSKSHADWHGLGASCPLVRSGDVWRADVICVFQDFDWGLGELAPIEFRVVKAVTTAAGPVATAIEGSLEYPWGGIWGKGLHHPAAMLFGLVEFRSTREVVQPADEASTTTTTSPAKTTTTVPQAAPPTRLAGHGPRASRHRHRGCRRVGRGVLAD